MDQRFPTPRSHIRRLYPDPIGNTEEWGFTRGIDGRITGVYSQSHELPLKQADFPAQWVDFNGMTQYSDWQFVAEKAFLDGPAGQVKTPSATADR